VRPIRRPDVRRWLLVGFFDDKPGASKQNKQPKANFRLIGCLALAYIAISMLRDEPAEDAMHPVLRIGVPLVFIAFAIGIGIHTVRKSMKQKKEAQEAGDADSSEDGGHEDNEPDAGEDREDSEDEAEEDEDEEV
jgi:choline-glycine betaine transporter